MDIGLGGEQFSELIGGPVAAERHRATGSSAYGSPTPSPQNQLRGANSAEGVVFGFALFTPPSRTHAENRK